MIHYTTILFYTVCIIILSILMEEENGVFHMTIYTIGIFFLQWTIDRRSNKK